MTLRWARISIAPTPHAEEAAAAALLAAGCTGTEHSAAAVAGYLPVDDRLQPALESLRARLDAWPKLGLSPQPPDWSVTLLDDEEWATAWRSHFQPIPVGRRLLIRPPWHAGPPPEGRAAVVIDPGMAFGTGHHATTRLCLEALETCVGPGSVVVDAGAGSGILAIAAAKLGAALAIGLECDPLACGIADENARVNDVADRVRIVCADSLASLTLTADVVVANILAPVVAAMAPDAAGCLAPGGAYIASGLVVEQQDAVRSAMKAAGLRVVEKRQEGEWVCLVGQRERGVRCEI